MFKGLFIVTCLLLGIHALPTELSNATDASNATAVGLTTSASFTFTLDYLLYPQSCENICFSWYCNKGPRSVAPDRVNAKAHRASNSCGKSTPNRCSISKGHLPGYQCDEWPWASSTAGGANAATRCIPAADNTGSGSSWGNFINNKGPQASGTVADGVLVDIKIINIPLTARFCLGEIGLPVPGCTSDAGQPMLQQIG
ncbi:deoxyribonuclease NucA/NucB-domain-containing protein [Armillaria luteobubalina]|uniref:Deoxyribonuclease NucA/NucB-domain-containing protein n=1 Tax=Armillaria luteobubalina TaxID=153913 RepID=A0AA39Q188_9AGAR|nr:deoxyribonuclease NucA/NucB-domain-containing protein [Armillaria luteobubalina]